MHEHHKESVISTCVMGLQAEGSTLQGHQWMKCLFQIFSVAGALQKGADFGLGVTEVQANVVFHVVLVCQVWITMWVLAASEEGAD